MKRTNNKERVANKRITLSLIILLVMITCSLYLVNEKGPATTGKAITEVTGSAYNSMARIVGLTIDEQVVEEQVEAEPEPAVEEQEEAEAERLVEEGKIEEAKELVQEVIYRCKDLVTGEEDRMSLTNVKKWYVPVIISLILIVAFIIIFVRKPKFNLYQKKKKRFFGFKKKRK